MARVLGIGGVFFKAKDPVTLAAWYEASLGMPISTNSAASFQPTEMPGGSFVVWGPFRKSTTYFDPAMKDYMFNLIVDNLDQALEQVQKHGAQIVGEIEEYDYGRFGWFLDPEDNKVELWQPPTS
jgi:predicted enzyme related to lactoylglutathione lyase